MLSNSRRGPASADRRRLARVEQGDLDVARVERRETHRIAGHGAVRIGLGRAADQHVKLAVQRVVIREPPRQQPIGTAEQDAGSAAGECSPLALHCPECGELPHHRLLQSPFASRRYHGPCRALVVAVGNVGDRDVAGRIVDTAKPAAEPVVASPVPESDSAEHLREEAVGAMAIRCHRERTAIAERLRSREAPNRSASGTVARSSCAALIAATTSSFSAASTERVA